MKSDDIGGFSRPQMLQPRLRSWMWGSQTDRPVLKKWWHNDGTMWWHDGMDGSPGNWFHFDHPITDDPVSHSSPWFFWALVWKVCPEFTRFLTVFLPRAGPAHSTPWNRPCLHGFLSFDRDFWSANSCNRRHHATLAAGKRNDGRRQGVFTEVPDLRPNRSVDSTFSACSNLTHG